MRPLPLTSPEANSRNAVSRARPSSTPALSTTSVRPLSLFTHSLTPSKKASSIGTSFLPYALNPHFSTFLEDPKYFLPSFALSVFPHEIAVTPEKWVRKTGNLGWIKGAFSSDLELVGGKKADEVCGAEAEDGGHFASLEEPRVFAEHVTEAIGALWKQ